MTVYEDLMIAVVIGIIIAIIRSLNELISKSNYKHKIIQHSNLDLDLNEQQKKDLNKLSISILQPEGPLFFGSKESLMNIYNNCSKEKVVKIFNLHPKLAIEISFR